MHEQTGLMTPASGALPSEKKDNVPAKLSQGEFVWPAEVVRFYGMERIAKMMNTAMEGISTMREQGMIQDTPPEPIGPPPVSNAQGAEGMLAAQDPRASVNEPPQAFKDGGLMAPVNSPQAGSMRIQIGPDNQVRIGSDTVSNPQAADLRAQAEEMLRRAQKIEAEAQQPKHSKGYAEGGLVAPRTANGGTDWSSTEFTSGLRDQYMRMIYQLHSQMAQPTGNTEGFKSPVVAGGNSPSLTTPSRAAPTPEATPGTPGPFDPDTSMDPRFNRQLQNPGYGGDNSPGPADPGSGGNYGGARGAAEAAMSEAGTNPGEQGSSASSSPGGPSVSGAPGPGDTGVGADGESGDGGGAPFAHGGLVIPRRR